MVKYECKYWLLFFICLFQAEYEIAPDEKLGEKGKEIMMKYLTPEVRGSQSGITEGMLQGTPLLNKVVTGFVSQTPKIYGGNHQWINLQVLHKQSERKKIIIQPRNWLLRMNLTYQGLNLSVDEQRASLFSVCKALHWGCNTRGLSCYQQMPPLFPIQLRCDGGISYSGV